MEPSTSVTSNPGPTAAEQLVTRSTYRQLLMKGLAPDEADHEALRDRLDGA